jgi:multiple RNA-binding domain-containing protein 1
MITKEKADKKKTKKDTEKDIKKLLKEQESDSDSDEDEYQDFSKLQSSRKSKSSEKKDEEESDESEIDEDLEDVSSEDESMMEVDDENHDDEEEASKSKMDVDGEKQSEKKKTKKKEESPSKFEKPLDASLVAETGRLFVRNLPFTATEEDVSKLFSRFGNVSEVHLSIDKLTKKSKGFGFVLFLFPGHAIEAQKELDGKFFQGRILHVMAAQQQQQEEANGAATQTAALATGNAKARGPGPQAGSSVGFVSEYQRKKSEKTKELANQDYNWNTLFIRPDAVASAMATSLSVSKSELLDPESGSSMAVRLALGETNIIKETKAFLEAEGVSLEALKGHYNKSISRSSTVILVKNIPTNTQVEELRSLFGPFGSLLRVVLPPSRTLAVVAFAAPTEARAAFRNLAYKLFKDAPLFLEWAPVGVFGEKPEETSDATPALKEVREHVTKHTASDNSASDTHTEITKSEQKVVSEKSTKATKKPSTAAPAAPTATAEAESSSTVLSKLGSLDSVIEEASLTLFIKNLSFDTSEDSLLKLAERLVGPVNHVSIAMHKVKDEMLSQGFGFVECKNREQAVKAWKLLQGSSLDGHQLQVTFSQRKTGSTSLAELQKVSSKRKVADASKPTSTKLMVKNVAFEATRNEIRDLFAPFGELRSVRLPNKAGGKGHRGFAFIEYVTPDEATAAVEALGNTHLYNRRLVIDYAEQDGDVEAIRAKTAAQFEN